MKQTMKSKYKKGLAIALVLLLVISLGAAFGYFTAFVYAKYNTKAANLQQDLTATFIATPIETGQGRELSYTVQNTGTVATDNRDTLTFAFTDAEGDAVPVSTSDMPLQLYWKVNCVSDSDYLLVARTGATPLTPASVSGNTITYHIDYSLDCGASSTNTLVAVFNPDFSVNLSEGTITQTITNTAKLAGKKLSAWATKDTATATCMFADDYVAASPVAAVYNTAGEFIGEYTTLKEAFTVAEQTAAEDAAAMAGVSTFTSRATADLPDDFLVTSGRVYVKVRLLVDEYIATEPITITSEHLIELWGNKVINQTGTALFTVSENSHFYLFCTGLFSEGGNLVSNYGNLYSAGSEFYGKNAPAIYNGTSATFYAGHLTTIQNGSADLGSGIYNCGAVALYGDVFINNGLHSNGTTASNIYLATENAAIYLAKTFSTSSRIGVAAAPFYDKTIIYTQDTDRITSAVANCFTFERQDILDEKGCQVFYYDAEFYLAQPLVYTAKSDGTYSATAQESTPRFINLNEQSAVADLSALDLSGNTVVREIWIPQTVTKIKNYAFNDMPNLTRVKWYGGELTNEPKSLFAGSTQLIKFTGDTTEDAVGSVTWLGGSAVPGHAFAESSLQIVDISQTAITYIDDSAFEDCLALTSITWNNNLETIGKSSFAGCTALTQTAFPASLRTITDFAFDECTSLGSITLNDGLQHIGAHAFDSNAITTITVPSTVRTVANEVFANCANLSKVYWNTPQCSLSIEPCAASIFRACPQLTTVGTASTDSIVLQAATTEIPAGFLSSMHKLSSVNIADTNITTIPDYCCHSSNLTTITLDKITRIEPYAFAYCSYITTLAPPKVEYIGDFAFRNCYSLSTFTAPETLTTIGPGVFMSDSSLSRVYWNATNCSVSSISAAKSNPIFKGCTRLTYVRTAKQSNAIIVNPTVKSLPAAFLVGSSIKDINLKDAGITQVPEAFAYKDTSLTGVKLPAGISTIDAQAFAGCTSLNYTVIRAESLTVVPTSFNDNFTIYYTGDEGTITGASNTLITVYCWCDDECLVDESGVITELVSTELLAADVLDLTGIVYVNSTNDLQTPLAYIKVGALDNSVATHVKFPNWHEPTEWDADVLPGNTVEATFMAEGYEDLLPDIWSTTSLNTVHYMKDGELLTATRPVKDYYTVLEWIESTGDEYIDTKILADNYLVFGVDFMQYNMNSSAQYVFGAQTANKLSDYGLYADTYPHLKFSGSTHNLSTFTSATYFEKRCTFTEYWRSGYHFWTLQSADGTKTSTNLNDPNNFANPQNIYIFALNNAGTAESFSRTRLYSMKIWNCDYPGNGNILARDFIPVLDQYGVACLYDKVSGELFYPQKNTLIPGPATGETIPVGSQPLTCANCNTPAGSYGLCPDGYCVDCAADFDIGGWCHGYCEDCGWTEDWCFDCAKCACQHETISCPDGCEFQLTDAVFCHCGYCSEQHDEYHREHICDHCDECGTWMFNDWSKPGDPINRCDDCGYCLDCCACNSGYTLDEDGNIIGIDWSLWYDESEYTEDTIPHHIIPDKVRGLTSSGKPMQATGVKGEEALSGISLRHLTLPASISYIDPMFFNAVTELEELTILNPNVYTKELGDELFKTCSFLQVIHAATPYTVLEYIHSTGSQYIDTGIYTDKDIEVDIDYVQYQTSSSQIQGIFGAWAKPGSSMYCLYTASGAAYPSMGLINSTKNFNTFTASTYFGLRTKFSTYLQSEFSNTHDIVFYTTAATAAQASQGGSGNVSASFSMYLFAVNHQDTSFYGSTMDLYACKIRNRFEVVRNFIPVIDSNNVPCLYDTVSCTAFYAQQGGLRAGTSRNTNIVDYERPYTSPI